MNKVYQKNIDIVIGPTVMVNNVPATSGHPECYVEVTFKLRLSVPEMFECPERNARSVAADFEETISSFLKRSQERVGPRTP